MTAIPRGRNGNRDTGFYDEMRDARRFCEECGRPLLVAQQQNGWDGYYGVPNYRERRWCADRRGLFSRHTDTGWISLTYIPPRPRPVPQPPSD